MENRNRKLKKVWLFIIMLGTAMSCNNQPGMPADSDTLPAVKDTAKSITIINGTHCFAYINNNDTELLSLTIQGNAATGSLVQNFYEKDKNTGIIKGRFYGDTLFAMYSFYSEGKQSERQVVFLRKGNLFQEGNGSMREEDGSLVFTNKANVAFNGNINLSQVDCNVFRKNN